MQRELFNRILSSMILFPLSIFIIVKGSLLFLFFVFFCFLIAVYEWQKMKISKLIKVLGISFLIFSFLSIYILRTNLQENYWPFIFIILICVSTDIGGYIFGKIFKGPKLTSLSPNKTYAGVVGSYTMCLLLLLVLLKINLINKQYFINTTVFIFVISSISQAGDILISYFKRLSKLKDTGNLIPGHGGLLDRIDGMIFAFPMSYLFFFTKYFSFIL